MRFRLRAGRMLGVCVHTLQGFRTASSKKSSNHYILLSVIAAVVLIIGVRVIVNRGDAGSATGQLSSLRFTHLLPTDRDIIDVIVAVSNNSRLLSKAKLQLFLHRFATQKTTTCNILKRFGNVGDGGYDVCLDPPFTPRQNLCIVYSFGINYDFSFDDAVNSEFNCDVHSFDPSMKEKLIPRYHVARRGVTFHHIGLHSADFVRDDGWTFKSFATIRQILGHSQSVIDVVKLDIELSEWPVLRDLIVSGEFRFIKTLLMEIHSPQSKAPVSFQDYINILRPLMALENAGFRKFMFHTRNDCCGSYQPMVHENMAHGKQLCCYELFYINMNFSPGVHGLRGTDSLAERMGGYEHLRFTDTDVTKYKQR